MPKLFDMWSDLRNWLEVQDAKSDGFDYESVLAKMDELENEHG